MESLSGTLTMMQPPCLINGHERSLFLTILNENGSRDQIIGCFFIYLNCLLNNLNQIVMSHEKAKEQTKTKKEPTKNLKEKRLAKKAKKEEKKRM